MRHTKLYDDRDFNNLFKHKLKTNFETCFSPRLSSVTGLVMVLARRPRWFARCDVFLAGDLRMESENEQKLAAGYYTSCSQPNCHLSRGSHYGGLVVLGLAVEILQTLVSVVLDVHGLYNDPGHWVRVFAENLNFEVGWGSLMVLLLVVPDEALLLGVELVFPVPVIW